MNTSFFKNCHHQLPCFTLQDYKIYECPFAAHIRHFSKKFHVDIPSIEGSDYLSLKTLTLDQLEAFAYQPKNVCKYCKPGVNWIWHLSDGSFNEYTKTLTELYFADYAKYEEIKSLTSVQMTNNVLSNVDPNFGISLAQENRVRWNGKLDIIIPYYTIGVDQINTLCQSLREQTIIDECMIYLISDNSPNEEQVIKIFNSHKDLNVIFFKNMERSGPGVARNKGIDKSFNKHVYFMDSDDYLFDPRSLEQAYNIISSSNYDVVATKRHDEKGGRYNQVDYMCSRDFLNNNNIRFGKYFLHEDLFFTYQLEMYRGRVFQSVFNGTVYKRYNNLNLSSTTTSADKIISKYFTMYQVCKRFSEENEETQLDMRGFIEEHLNQFGDISGVEAESTISILTDPELVENIYYILMKSLDLVKNKIRLNNLCPLLQSLLKDDFIIVGSASTNFETLERKVRSNFKKYRYNLFLTPIIKELEGR
jgi:glycosyltransferase involved in cell wall biosynthesis